MVQLSHAPIWAALDKLYDGRHQYARMMMGVI
jgi:hypothetical protein